MPLYEHVCIARQELSNPQVDGLFGEIEGALVDLGGKVVDKEYWGARKLAYAIKKNRRAHYLFLKLDAPAEAVIEVERKLRINEDVLRYLTIRVNQHSTQPTPIMETST